MMRRVCMLLCLALMPLLGQEMFNQSEQVHVDSFSTQGKTPDGKMDWILTGEYADVTDSITLVGPFLLRMTSENKVYDVRSHNCRYLNALREIKSKAAVHLNGKGLTVSGIGYDLYLDAQTLRIRNYVKIDMKIARTSWTGFNATKDKEK